MIKQRHLFRGLLLLALGTVGCGEGFTDPALTGPDQPPEPHAPSPAAGFRDDFGSGDLSSWEVERAVAVLAGGVVELTHLDAGIAGRMNRSLEAPIESWEVRARLGRAQTDSVVASVIIITGHERYALYALDLGSGVALGGEDTNYRFYVLDQTRPWPEENPWVAVEGAYGVSDAVQDGAREYTEVTATQEDGALRVRAGDTELFAVTLASDYPTRMTGVGVWVFPLDGAADRAVLLDWVEVSGTGTAGASAAVAAWVSRTPRNVPGAR